MYFRFLKIYNQDIVGSHKKLNLRALMVEIGKRLA